MKERRQHKRLTIPLPVRLKVINGSKKMVLDLESRDISYSGTYVPILTFFPAGTRFVMDFTIPNKNLKDFMSIDLVIGCAGTMVRSDPHGIAIEFDKEYQIKNLKDL
jgi:hypothetical protein